jgi:hypothetical protein
VMSDLAILRTLFDSTPGFADPIVVNLRAAAALAKPVFGFGPRIGQDSPKHRQSREIPAEVRPPRLRVVDRSRLEMKPRRSSTMLGRPTPSSLRVKEEDRRLIASGSGKRVPGRLPAPSWRPFCVKSEA